MSIKVTDDLVGLLTDLHDGLTAGTPVPADQLARALAMARAALSAARRQRSAVLAMRDLAMCEIDRWDTVTDRRRPDLVILSGAS